MADASSLVETCVQAARAGGAELMSWQGRFSVTEKGRHDLVTDADLASEAAVRRVVEKIHPRHAILAEESPVEDQLAQEFCWVVDPLDGTTNYAHGFPCFCVSVAVAHRGKVVAGAIYDPLAGEMFVAGADRPAMLNDVPIRVSSVRRLDESLVAVSLPPNLTPDSADLQSLVRTAPLCQAVRRTGSAALNLAYVASGRLDAHWAHRIHPWDAAAGVLLVRQAGGVVTGSRGGPFVLADAHYMAAANQELLEALLPHSAGEVR